MMRSVAMTIITGNIQGPVVQSVVTLTSPLVVKILTVLISTISNPPVFLLKNVSSFCKCKNISIYAIFNGQNFNDTLTNDIVSFEQLSPEIYTVGKYQNFLLILRSC